MPTLIAMLIASIAGWLVESPVRAILGPVPSTAASLIVGAVAFFFAKQFVSDLRGGS
jgi:undecaprenyl pyrophosphate phosphatase UppP